jgi:hypothetical protein
MDGDGAGRFHTQTKCINGIIKFDSKQKKKICGFIHIKHDWIN